MAKKKSCDANEILETMNKMEEPNEAVLDGIFDNVQPVEKVKEEQKVGKEELVPTIGSQDWTSFVLSKFNPDELYNNCPTFEGLRRVCYDLLGTIVDVDIDIRQTPNYSNSNHSCVVARLTIEHPINYTWLGDVAGRTIRYSHVGDVFMGNTSDSFSWKFSSSTCCTRTKAALLRDAFRLKFVYSAEEMSDLSDDNNGSSGLANSVQFDGLSMLCERINIDAEKFTKGVWRQAKPKDTPHQDLNLLPFTTAAQCFALIQSYQQKRDTIPDTLKGYKKDWTRQLKCMK